MASLTDGRFTGFTDAPANTIVLLENEVMHAVSLLLWGHPGGAEDAPRDSAAVEAWRRGGWLREGIAAVAEARCGPRVSSRMSSGSLAGAAQSARRYSALQSRGSAARNRSKT
jgi:hypothetical protein